jgi:peptide methionine sulfoxide reductase MsrB
MRGQQAVGREVRRQTDESSSDVLRTLPLEKSSSHLGSVFDDQATKVMGEAFEAARKDLDEAGQSSAVYEAIAKCIIEMVKSGERDPNQSPGR